jgi:hypothetical protein
MPAKEAVGKSAEDKFRWQFPGRLTPLIGCQIPLFGSVAEFHPDSNRISHLQGRFGLGRA